MSVNINIRCILIFLVGLMLFVVGFGQQEMVGFDSRFYLFALEMWRHGPSWFATTYQQPYPDYLATSTVLIYSFAKLVGGLSKFSAIFPSAVAAAMTLSVTYLIGARQHGRWGFAAVCFLLLTNAFVAEARAISLDQYTTLITALSFYVVSRVEKKSADFLWIFLLFIAGFAMRGPIGLVMPAGVVCIYLLMDKKVKSFFLVGLGALLVLVLCSMMLLALAYQVGGMVFVNNVLQMEVLGRIQDVKSLPWHFYWVESIGAYALSYPLAVLVVLGVRFCAPADRKIISSCIVWALVILIGMSVPMDKKIRYILPMTPALALVCGYVMTVSRENKYYYFLQCFVRGFCFVFPIVSLCALFIIQQKFPNILLNYKVLFVMLSVLQIAVLFFLRKPLVKLSLVSVAFVLMYGFVVQPINVQLNQTRAFVQQIESLRLKQHAKLVFYREGTDAWVIKYVMNMPTEETPQFVLTEAEMQAFPQGTFYVMSKENYQEVSTHISTNKIAEGYVGRVPVVVLIKP